MVTTRSFENPEEHFGRVSADTFARIMGQTADISMIVDAGSGMIHDVAYGASGLIDAGLAPLIGSRLNDLVTTESRPKVESLLTGGSADGRWRHLNFPVTGSEDIPISVQAFGLGGGRLLAIGRDERRSAVVQRRFMTAQRELEDSHARLRQSDLRFQTMLALSDLAVLTIDGETLVIQDINTVARATLEAGAAVSIGQSFLQLLDRADVESARADLIRAAGSGRVASFSARLRSGKMQAFQTMLFRYEHASRLLVRLVGEEASPDNGERQLLARLPHGMVITGPDLRIAHVNRAFIDMAQLSIEENATGQSLERFIGRNGVDTGIIVAALREQTDVRDFVTVLVGAFGSSIDIDLDAVRLDGGQDKRYGFFIRRASSGRRSLGPDAGEQAGLADRMTKVVGRMPLKEIVRETTDVIERLCIETALGMTDNNRAAAAEMLGISRQGLYAKLARFGDVDDGANRLDN